MGGDQSLASLLNLRSASGVRKVHKKVDAVVRFSVTDCGVRCRRTAALRRMKFVPLAELFAPLGVLFFFALFFAMLFPPSFRGGALRMPTSFFWAHECPLAFSSETASFS